METSLAYILEMAENFAAYDRCAKKILSYKDVAAYIVKYCTNEFRDYDVGYIADHSIGDVSISTKAVHQDQKDKMLSGEERIIQMNSESSSMKEGKVFYDIRFKATVPGEDKPILLIINIEMQKNDHPGYSVVTRAIYYSARMISEQYGTVFTDDNYQDIQKTYSIWICPTPAGKRENSIVRFNIAGKVEYGKPSALNDKADYDKMEVVVISLGNPEDAKENELLDLLSTLFSKGIPVDKRKNILSTRYRIRMTKEFESEVTEVSRLSYAIAETGFNKGLAKGREEGQLELLFKLFIGGNLSLTVAATQANMTEEEFLKKKEEYEKANF